MSTNNKPSFIEYAKENFKIRHWKKGLIPFESNKSLEDLANLLNNNKYVIASKYRQGGFSHFNYLWALYKCLTEENQKFLLFFRTDSEICRYLNTQVCATTGNLPFNPGIVRHNDHRIEFNNGNCIWFLTPSRVCGLNFNSLIIDEAAFFRDDDLERHYAALTPLFHYCNNVFLVSTPNGKRGLFYKLHQDALLGESHYVAYEASYKDHPDFQSEEWEISTQKNLGEKGWRQEYLGEFLDV